MKSTIVKRVFSIVILTVSLMSICVSAVSAADIAAPVISFQEFNPNARGTSAPSKSDEKNLSNNPHVLDGSFLYLAYTDSCFRPDGNGELEFYIDIDYQDVDVLESGEGWNMRKALTVELWEMDNGIFDIDGDTRVYNNTTYSDYYDVYADTYCDYVVNTDVITGLDPLKLYYIVIIKTNDGLRADITGSISHPADE